MVSELDKDDMVTHFLAVYSELDATLLDKNVYIIIKKTRFFGYHQSMGGSCVPVGNTPPFQTVISDSDC